MIKVSFQLEMSTSMAYSDYVWDIYMVSCTGTNDIVSENSTWYIIYGRALWDIICTLYHLVPGVVPGVHGTVVHTSLHILTHLTKAWNLLVGPNCKCTRVPGLADAYSEYLVPGTVGTWYWPLPVSYQAGRVLVWIQVLRWTIMRSLYCTRPYTSGGETDWQRISALWRMCN